MNVDKLRQKLEPHVADHDSEEGREVIRDGGHVYEIWEDGELTSTKGGELFRKRILHRIHFPFLNEDLWEVPEDSKHVSKVVVNEEAKEILERAREGVRA